jgi:hypothetical protein
VIILPLLEKSLKIPIIPDKIPFAYYRGKVLDSEYRFKSHMRVLERIKEVVENIENDKR